MPTHKENLQLVVGAKDKGAGAVLKRIKGAVLGIGAAYLGWRSAKAIISSIIELGMESEKVWNDVRASLDRHNISVEENLGSIQKFAGSLQNLTGISDELIGEGIQVLLDYNNDLQTSFDLIKVATDLSVGGHMDLKAALDLVGKASVGYTGTLSRYGIIIDEAIPKSEKFAEAVRQINQRFGGAAAERMETTYGKVELLKQTWADFLESIFKSGEAKDVMDGLLSAITVWIRELIPLINISIRTILSWGKTFIDTISAVTNVINDVGNIYKSFFTFHWGEMADAFKQYQINLSLAAIQLSLDIDAAVTNSLLLALELARVNSEAIAAAFNKTKEGVKETITITQEANEEIKTGFEEQVEAHEEAVSQRIKAMKWEMNERHKGWAYLWSKEFEMSKNITRLTRITATSMAGAMTNAMSNIVDGILDGEVKIKEIWKQMYKDFIKYFIDAILEAVAGKLVKGLISILGSIFDNPINDRIAYMQGSHYAGYFTQGVLDNLRGGGIGRRMAENLNIPSPLNQQMIIRSPQESYSSGGAIYNFYVQPDYSPEEVLSAVDEATKFAKPEIGGQLITEVT